LAKKRVYELAKELGITSRELLIHLKELEIPAKSHASALEEETYHLIKELLEEKPAEKKGKKEKPVEKKEKIEEKTEKAGNPRPPVVTVMGHVDHGKTTLLDAIRKTSVVAEEFGEITQHIGAYQVETPHGKITFIDTPGHEAFSTLRARGAQVTDIVILVVAADDGVQPQTIEAINHARAAETPIIVVINKIDRPNAQPQKILNQLMQHGIVPESMGGDNLTIETSALKGEGIEELLEAILLQAELMELKAPYDVPARGVIIETRIPRGEGPQGTVIIKEGTLKTGDNFVAGLTYGRVKRMKNDRGEQIREAIPSTPVEVLGFQDLPTAGDWLEVVKNEKTAKKMVEERIRKSKKRAPVPIYSIEELKKRMEIEEVKELNIIIKGDTQGSVEALKNSLEKLAEKEVKVKCIHEGIGNVNRSDVLLASTTGSMIIGFHVGKENQVDSLAKGHGVTIKFYKIIYEAIDDIGRIIKSLVTPEMEEVKIGEAEIRKIFEIPRLGKVAGSYVLQGKIKRGVRFEIKRDEEIIGEGRIASLRRFKEDVKEVREGYECGIGLSGFDDFQEGDKIIAYEEREKQQ